MGTPADISERISRYIVRRLTSYLTASSRAVTKGLACKYMNMAKIRSKRFWISVIVAELSYFSVKNISEVLMPSDFRNGSISAVNLKSCLGYPLLSIANKSEYGK